jgi:hypothetical protein
MKVQHHKLTDGKFYFLLLSRQPVVVEEIKPSLRLPVRHQANLRGEQNAEMTLATHNPYWVLWSLEVCANLKTMRNTLDIKA